MTAPDECPIQKAAHELYKQREYYIDLFCKTFFVSQEPKSPEELRALFEMFTMEIKFMKDPMHWKIQMVLKDDST